MKPVKRTLKSFVLLKHTLKTKTKTRKPGDNDSQTRVEYLDSEN